MASNQGIERETLWVRSVTVHSHSKSDLPRSPSASSLQPLAALPPRRGPAPPPPPTPVGVIVVAEQPVTLTAELPGRTSPYETSEVRPQVDGIIRARLFTEGDSSAPASRSTGYPVAYEARVANARAAVARAQASTIGAEGLARRYAELLKRNFVSRQNYDDASRPPAPRAPTLWPSARP